MSFIDPSFHGEFEWDFAKRDACLLQRGFDFAYVLQAFGDPDRVVVADKRRDESFRRARPIVARSPSMKTVRISVDFRKPSTLPKGHVDPNRLDATTEADLAAQEAEDDVEAMQDAARYVRRVRRRLGLTQQEFARRIDVPLDTIRNWEQGRRCPTGAAKSLLKILDKAPETALLALG